MIVKAKNNKIPDVAQVHGFASRAAWATWLEQYHRKSPGLWLRLAKKGSGLKSVSYPEAVEVALCYGWIDSQKQSETGKTWLQKFVPRSDHSVWSKINRQKALALIKSGKMKPAGRKAIERAKGSGHWQRAYDSPSRALVPSDLQAALNANVRAQAFFTELDGANRYAVLFRIQTAKKPETRARKIREFVEMLEQNQTIHPLRKPRRSSG
ncbi:MAG TPA: YdeI/OmpD-associated family protein [Terriglobales bacterium]|nr:YdeI/OmpD-associated family protein [Terriglobales bacterium]